jgi:hypothetical protein
MLLKANGLFDNEERPTRISDRARKAMNDLYASLSTEPAHVEKLNRAELAAFAQAAAVNASYDQYITFG